MPTFRYSRPATLDEAVSALAEGAVALAGGTDLIVGLRHGKVRPKAVVDLKAVANLPDGVDETAGVVRVGGAAVMREVIDHPAVRRHFVALVEAAVKVGSVQIRNRATLAGNICNASPAADTAPPLLTYGAVVNSYGIEGHRTTPIAAFFEGPGRTVLGPGEIVVSIDLPVPDQPVAAAFTRLTRRRGVDLATVSVACVVEANGSARFGLGAVGPTPLLVQAERSDLDDETLDGLLDVAAPIGDVRAGADYRHAMLRVLARRALATARERLEAARA